MIRSSILSSTGTSLPTPGIDGARRAPRAPINAATIQTRYRSVPHVITAMLRQTLVTAPVKRLHLNKH